MKSMWDEKGIRWVAAALGLILILAANTSYQDFPRLSAIRYPGISLDEPAVLSAFIIPIGALVVGEGLPILVLESRTGTSPHEARWQEVEFTVTYRALFVRYLQRGFPDREAKLKALADVKGYLTSARPSGVRALSAGSEQDRHVNGQRSDSMKNELRGYLDEHVEAEQLSVNQLWTRLQTEGVRVGRTSVAEVLKERRQRVLA